MKFVTAKETLVALMQATSYIVEDVIIECGAEGWSLFAVDPANVACVKAKIPEAAFDYYELPGAFDGEVGRLPIDLSRLDDKLKAFDNGSQVALETEDGKLIVSSGGLKYKLALLDQTVVRKPPSLPVLDLPVKVVMDAQTYLKAVKALAKLSDVVRFETAYNEKDGDVFMMTGKGDIDSARLKVPVDTLLGYKPGNASSLINSDYLEDIAKSIKGAGEVELEIGRDYPLILRAKIHGVEAEYVVAPRIERD